ncbi:hypothetical protein EVAR_62526_1 [Eumeta japonica]|uniref:Uncharacterized protein n=1 Tax=Eumeta variegata TaxID=151549 RepID=A0A4C1ZGB0_EUMVA|nr:hypothetical protein EVAR_62526_1 [Eumeta japonica]
MSSVQYSNARGREKEKYTKVESRREKERESVDLKHMRLVTVAHRHWQAQRSHHCVAGLLESNRISDEQDNGLMEEE